MNFLQGLLPGQELLIYIQGKHEIRKVFIGLVVTGKEGPYGMENPGNGTFAISSPVIVKIEFPSEPAPDVFNPPHGVEYPDRPPEGFNQMESFSVQAATFKGMEEQVNGPELIFTGCRRPVLPEAIVIEPVIWFCVF